MIESLWNSRVSKYFFGLGAPSLSLPPSTVNPALSCWWEGVMFWPSESSTVVHPAAASTAIPAVSAAGSYCRSS